MSPTMNKTEPPHQPTLRSKFTKRRQTMRELHDLFTGAVLQIWSLYTDFHTRANKLLENGIFVQSVNWNVRSSEQFFWTESRFSELLTSVRVSSPRPTESDHKSHTLLTLTRPSWVETQGSSFHQSWRLIDTQNKSLKMNVWVVPNMWNNKRPTYVQSVWFFPAGAHSVFILSWKRLKDKSVWIHM